MRILDRDKTAELVRKRRKELKLKLDDLKDENISTPTISNIERAVANVTNEKILYLANKLGLRTDDLPDLVDDSINELKEIKFDLFRIESLTHSNPSKGVEELDRMKIKKDHPLAYLYQFLYGKCYSNLLEWAQAEIHFLEAIHLLKQQSAEWKKTNIVAASYYELSRTVYYRNALEPALQYTLEGLKHFVEDGERQHYRFFLLTGKSVYLEKLNRLEESIREIEELWDTIDTITSIEAKLLVYEQRSKILKRFKIYDEAIECCKEGIRMAHATKTYDRELDLWTLLGSIHFEIDELDTAEKCYLTALELKEKIEKEYLFVTPYTQLGLLYTKREDWIKSQEVLESAVHVGQKTKDGVRYIEALTALGNCLERQKQYADAIQTYKEALKFAKTHNFISLEQELILKQGACYRKTGDENNYNTCVNRFFEIGLLLEGGEHV